MRWLIDPLFAAISILCASAQTIPYQQGYEFGRSIPIGNSWAGPVFLELAPVTGGRTGRVWLRQTPQGLLIFARTSGGPPEYPRFPAEMATRESIGVWLALAPKVDMPEIGWGNQFGLTSCTKQEPGRKLADAEACSSWSARQVEYREQLRRLFVRHWKLAPRVTVEDFASDAWRAALMYANDLEQRAFVALEPRSGPSMDGGGGADSSSFEIFVPWSAFPPTSSLTVSRVYLSVDIMTGDTLRSTTTPARKGGDPATFTRLDLERPLVSRVSSCGYSLEGSDVFDSRYPAWYFPDATGSIWDTFSVPNDIHGYRYEPEGLSPIPAWTHYFSKDLGNGERVCGPVLRYVAGARTFDSKDSIDPDHLSSRRQADGAFLFRYGPSTGILTRLGAGQCGSCGTLGVSVYNLSPLSGITVALKCRVVTDNLTDADIQFSSDWKTVTLYEAKLDPESLKPVWSFTRYCLVGATYGLCGSGPTSSPPSPRQFILPR